MKLRSPIRSRLAGLAMTATLPGLLLASCGSSSAPTGVIRGELLTDGGLSTTPHGQPFRGHVKAEGDATSYVTSVPASGRFTLRGPVGTYSLAGSSPQFGSGQYACRAASDVRVTPGTTSHAIVVCHEK